MRLSKKLFFLLVLLLPLNLGKHFELRGSYVWGTLSDYLVPVIYIQDLLIFLILLFWLLEKGLPSFSTLLKFLNQKTIQIAVLFCASVFFSVLSSERSVPSFFIFLRIGLNLLLFFYILFEVSPEKDFPVVTKLLAANVLFLGILAIFQFIKQGSVFNNYLFFGEQPYSNLTWGVAKEYVFGASRIPAYGLFRHPNIFGGYLSIILLWVFSRYKDGQVFKFAFYLGLAALLLTFSYVAWAGFILGFISFLYIGHYKKGSYLKKKQNVTYMFLILFFIVNSLTPFFVYFTREASFYRRGNLLNTSLLVIKKFPLFGIGPGSFVSHADELLFMQPVHNIFLLVFSECGVFSLVLFMVLLMQGLFKQLNPSYFSLFLISVLQVLFIGSLDHYFWTIHQTFLLLWMILGFVLKDSRL